jgi:uncharacterized protein YlaN (UPF0358 family)
MAQQKIREEELQQMKSDIAEIKKLIKQLGKK